MPSAEREKINLNRSRVCSKLDKEHHQWYFETQRGPGLSSSIFDKPLKFWQRATFAKWLSQVVLPLRNAHFHILKHSKLSVVQRTPTIFFWSRTFRQIFGFAKNSGFSRKLETFDQKKFKRRLPTFEFFCKFRLFSRKVFNVSIPSFVIGFAILQFLQFCNSAIFLFVLQIVAILIRTRLAGCQVALLHCS